jgi:hypothetical protein
MMKLLLRTWQTPSKNKMLLMISGRASKLIRRTENVTLTHNNLCSTSFNYFYSKHRIRDIPEIDGSVLSRQEYSYQEMVRISRFNALNERRRSMNQEFDQIRKELNQKELDTIKQEKEFDKLKVSP